MVVRAKDNSGSNASFEVISQRLAGLQAQVNGVMGLMSSMETKTDITKASPSIPFKIDEEKRNDGIYILVSMVIPSNAARVNITLVSVFQNTAQSGETTAQSIARGKAHLQEFTVKCTDNERASNLCVQYIGPLQPKDNPLKNQYHLVLLEVKNKGEKALTQNPMADPFATFPFQVFKVRNDGANDTENTYFSTGDTSIGKKPSKPDKSLIVMNDVNLATQAADATVQFKIFAAVDANGNPDMTTTFDDLDINECYVALRLFSQTPDTTGDTQNPLKPGGPISDKTKPFTIVEIILPLATRYLWTRNITKNASGKEVNTPGIPVDFYAGGDIGTTGLPEFSGGTLNTPTGGLFTIAAIQLDNAHTEVQVRIRQRGASLPAILLKRILLFKTLPSGTQKQIETIKLLDEEAVFTRTTDIIIPREIKHVANRVGIRYDARMIAVGHTPSVPLQRDAAMAMADSTFSIAPSAPASNLITTAPDSDTDEANDSFADFTVSASATNPSATFADTGADHICIVLRKNGGLIDDDPDDNRLPKYTFPIEDINVTSAIFRVRGLKTGRQYTWRRNIAIRSGINVKSVGAFINFRAGQMLIDPSGVSISIVSITQEDKSFLVRVRIIQTTPPTLIRSVSLFKDKQQGAGFIEIANSKVRIKDKPEFQMPAANQTLDIEINAIKNTTAQIRPRIVAVGGLTKDGTAVAAVATGGQPPSQPPSLPTLADIITNTVSGDISSGNGIVVFRLFATWQRATTGQGGTGPGGSLSFNDVGADSAAVVIAEPGASPNNQMFPAANFDPTQNSTDIAVELTFGKPYLFRRNITFSQGIPNRSTIVDIQFTCGGRISTTNLSELTAVSLQLFQVLKDDNTVDNRQVDAQVNFTQPSFSVLIKRIEFYKKRNIDGQFKLVGREPLIDDISYQTVGSKSYNLAVQVPASATFNIQAILIGVGDSPTNSVRRIVGPTNIVMPADASGNDTARPQWGGLPVFPTQTTLSTTVPRLRVRYANNGSVKIKANLPDRQVKTLITCRVALSFRLQLIFGIPPNQVIIPVIYTWNPETNQFINGLAGAVTDFGSGGNPNVVRFDPEFYIDIGKGINTAFFADKPTISGSRPNATIATFGDIPPQIVNDLLSAYNNFLPCYLEARIVAVTNFDPLNEFNSSVGVICSPSTINFPFVGSDRGPAADFFTYLPSTFMPG